MDFDRWVDESEGEEEVESGVDNAGSFDPKEADREMFRRWAEDTRTKESDRIYTSNKWKDRHTRESLQPNTVLKEEIFERIIYRYSIKKTTRERELDLL